MYRITGDKRGTTITWEENFSDKYAYRDFWHVFKWSREICNHGYRLNLKSIDYDVLYDLIKADLVEKVEDK